MKKKLQRPSPENYSGRQKVYHQVNRVTDDRAWEAFMKDNPDLADDPVTARLIFNSLRPGKADVSEDGIISVWNNVEGFLLRHKDVRPGFYLTRIIRIAAMIIITAGFLFVIMQQAGKKEKFEFAHINTSQDAQKEARLILSGGEEITLKEEHSEIRFDSLTSRIEIEHDSSFSYAPAGTMDAMNQVYVPHGKRSDIQLSDGTRVCLNAGSGLIFPQKFTGKQRKVFLNGEAYFDVKKISEKSFVVCTGNMDITVLGTQFNLKANDSEADLEVVLVEGSISMKENKMLELFEKEIVLKPRQRAVYHKDQNKTIIESNVNVDYFTCWKEGFFEFEKESILNVFNRLSKYYNVEFISDKRVELNRRISGKLDLKDSLEDVLKVLADAAPVSFRVDKEKIFVDSRIEYIRR